MGLFYRHVIGLQTMTRRFLACVVFCWITLVMAGCASIPLPGAGKHDVDRPELSRKRVVGKEPPTELIAEDGARCLTTKARFERTIIGAEVWCAWRGAPNRAGRLPSSR